MLLYYLFWMLMGFILHFYNIFATNLLTGGPAQIAVFLPSPQPPFYSTYSAISMAHAHVLREN